jgi:hypothetical protein
VQDTQQLTFMHCTRPLFETVLSANVLAFLAKGRAEPAFKPTKGLAMLLCLLLLALAALKAAADPILTAIAEAIAPQGSFTGAWRGDNGDKYSK